jgi:hypothetical protein
MSQKSSVSQAAKSVSQALMSDRLHNRILPDQLLAQGRREGQAQVVRQLQGTYLGRVR